MRTLHVIKSNLHEIHRQLAQESLITEFNFLLLSSFIFNHGHEFQSKNESIFIFSIFKMGVFAEE